jgi:hypothetical protein
LSSSASLWRAPTLLTEFVTTNDATRVLWAFTERHKPVHRWRNDATVERLLFLCLDSNERMVGRLAASAIASASAASFFWRSTKRLDDMQAGSSELHARHRG